MFHEMARMKMQSNGVKINSMSNGNRSLLVLITTELDSKRIYSLKIFSTDMNQEIVRRHTNKY